MTTWTPWSAAAGGALIGLAAVLLLALNGRIAGISGILNGALFGTADDRLWRALFLVGLVVGGSGFHWITDNALVTRQDFSTGLLALAGVLVGVGTRMGSGCTSGHGVCGIARLSGRSLVATTTFLGVGMAVASAVHLFGRASS